jgi:hypothetical protein
MRILSQAALSASADNAETDASTLIDERASVQLEVQRRQRELNDLIGIAQTLDAEISASGKSSRRASLGALGGGVGTIGSFPQRRTPPFASLQSSRASSRGPSRLTSRSQGSGYVTGNFNSLNAHVRHGHLHSPLRQGMGGGGVRVDKLTLPHGGVITTTSSASSTASSVVDVNARRRELDRLRQNYSPSTSSLAPSSLASSPHRSPAASAASSAAVSRNASASSSASSLSSSSLKTPPRHTNDGGSSGSSSGGAATWSSPRSDARTVGAGSLSLTHTHTHTHAHAHGSANAHHPMAMAPMHSLLLPSPLMSLTQAAEAAMVAAATTKQQSSSAAVKAHGDVTSYHEYESDIGGGGGGGGGDGVGGVGSGGGGGGHNVLTNGL